MQVGTTYREMNRMKELLTVVTRKGQITVPVEIRRALDLQEGDKVALVLGENQVQLRRAGSVVERTAGILRGAESVLGAQELREAAEQAIAEDVVERLGAG